METETAALIVSAISLLVAGLSLGWQMAQWLLSAARPKAQLMHGVVDGGGAYVGPVGRSGKRMDVQQFRRQGITGPEVIGIQVTNHGRAPLVVEKITVLTRGGSMSFMPVAELIGPSMPQRIEPGTNQSWYVDLERANSLAASSRS